MNTTQLGQDANYRATVRVFPDVVEMTVKVINHDLERKRSDSMGFRRPKKASKDQDLFYVPTEEEVLERQRKDEENKERAVRRAKQSIRWNVQRLQANYLLTLTYRENMTDIEQLKKDFDIFRRMVQARYPKWSYVAAREKQKRGAWHLHLAVVGWQDINYLRKCWYKTLGCPNATKENTLGQVNIIRSKKSGYQWDSRRSIAGYIAKYIAKDFHLHEHSSKRYWVSRGAPKPVITKYWLTSDDITQMIKDALQIGQRHGMTSMPDFFQNFDRTLLYFHGSTVPIPI